MSVWDAPKIVATEEWGEGGDDGIKLCQVAPPESTANVIVESVKGGRGSEERGEIVAVGSGQDGQCVRSTQDTWDRTPNLHSAR